MESLNKDYHSTAFNYYKKIELLEIELNHLYELESGLESTFRSEAFNALNIHARDTIQKAHANTTKRIQQHSQDVRKYFDYQNDYLDFLEVE